MGVGCLQVGDSPVDIDATDRVGLAGLSRAQHPVDRLGAEVELGGARAPLRSLRIGIDVVVLGIAGPVGGHFRCRGGAGSALGHLHDDLRPALAEVVDQRALDPSEVGIAIDDCLPFGPQLAGHEGAKGGLVDVAGGLRLAQQRRLALWIREAEPAPVGDGAGHVRGDDVAVEGGIAGPRGAVQEAHRDEARALLDHRPALAALDEAGVAFEVGECLADRVVVAAHDRRLNLSRADRP